jgi:hypothetical protein
MHKTMSPRVLETRRCCMKLHRADFCSVGYEHLVGAVTNSSLSAEHIPI